MLTSLLALPFLTSTAGAMLTARLVAGPRPAPAALCLALDQASRPELRETLRLGPLVDAALAGFSRLQLSDPDDRLLLGALTEDLSPDFEGRLAALLKDPARDPKEVEAVFGELVDAQHKAALRHLPAIREETDRILKTILASEVPVSELWAAASRFEKHWVFGPAVWDLTSRIRRAANAARDDLSLRTARMIADELLKNAMPSLTGAVVGGRGEQRPGTAGLRPSDRATIANLTQGHPLQSLRFDPAMIEVFTLPRDEAFSRAIGAPAHNPVTDSYEYKRLRAWRPPHAGRPITPPVLAHAAFSAVAPLFDLAVTFSPYEIVVTGWFERATQDDDGESVVRAQKRILHLDQGPEGRDESGRWLAASELPEFRELMRERGISAVPNGETRDSLAVYVIEMWALPPR
ncbi:MAG: hypothetical protein HY554_16970 [Elusimicrobia bacterium]|nr:hypothetical protein [Elusimicrobiota bacterium]